MSSLFFKMKVMDTIKKPGFQISCIGLVCSLVYDLNIALFWSAVWYCLIILNRRTDNKRLQTEISMFDPEIPQILDAIIVDCLNEYVALNLGYEKDKVYISDKEEIEINHAVLDNVIKRLSKITLLKLRAYYAEELLEQVIAERISMAVMNFVINFNATSHDGNDFGDRPKTQDISKALL